MSFKQITRGTGLIGRVMLRNGAVILDGAGAPTSGTSGTGVGEAVAGSFYIDVTNSQWYINAGSKTSPSWQNMGGAAAVDGLGSLGVARATFNPTATAGERTVAAHGLGVTIPDKSIVVGGVVQVNTAFTSGTSAATVAISVQSANDIITAAAVSGAPFSTTGLKGITPKANTPESTGIALSAAREITATVAVEALTGGKATINLYYLRGA